jgi:hypothetical protein
MQASQVIPSSKCGITHDSHALIILLLYVNQHGQGMLSNGHGEDYCPGDAVSATTIASLYIFLTEAFL